MNEKALNSGLQAPAQMYANSAILNIASQEGVWRAQFFTIRSHGPACHISDISVLPSLLLIHTHRRLGIVSETAIERSVHGPRTDTRALLLPGDGFPLPWTFGSVQTDICHNQGDGYWHLEGRDQGCF